MPQVTAIKPQKKNPKRFNIYLDGRFAFGLPVDNLIKAGLAVDQEISQEKIDQLIKENEFQKIYEQVINFFSYRPRSEKELSDWFRRKEVGEEVQKLLKVRLKQLEYLDDEKFAKWWIDQRATFRPTGSRLLALELRQKGIKSEVIDRLKSKDTNLESEKEQAVKVAVKKWKLLGKLSPLEGKKKLSDALLRRGFGWETVEEVVDEITRKD